MTGRADAATWTGDPGLGGKRRAGCGRGATPSIGRSPRGAGRSPRDAGASARGAGRAAPVTGAPAQDAGRPSRRGPLRSNDGTGIPELSRPDRARSASWRGWSARLRSGAWSSRSTRRSVTCSGRSARRSDRRPSAGVFGRPSWRRSGRPFLGVPPRGAGRSWPLVRSVGAVGVGEAGAVAVDAGLGLRRAYGGTVGCKMR